MSKELIKYTTDISLDQKEDINLVINKFIIFLNENDIENNYFKDVIRNDITTQIIIYVLYKLISLNFTLLNIREVSTILPKEIKGGTIEDMIIFLLILILLSNIFTSVDSILSSKPTRFIKLHTRSLSTTRIFNNYTPEFTKSSRTSPSKNSPSKNSPSKTSPSKTSPSKTSPSKTSPSKTSPSKTSPSKTSPSKTSIISVPDKFSLKTTTISKFMFQFNNTINKIVYKLNNETKKIKEQKGDKMFKWVVTTDKLLTSVDFVNIKDLIFSSSEIISSIKLRENNKELLEKISLEIKKIDTLINIVLLAMKFLIPGNKPTNIELAFSFAKVATSIGQIIQKIYIKENTKLKELLDILSNILIFRDIGIAITQLSILYLGYIGLVIYSFVSKRIGGKTNKKRNKKRRKTRKLIII